MSRFFILTLICLLSLRWLPLAAAAGDLDPTFGNHGRLLTQLGVGIGNGNALIRQADGKLLVGGDHTLARLDRQGQLDPTFGSGGLQPTLPTIAALALQADQKVLVAGKLLEEGLETVADFVVVRYLPDGQLDPSFATAGMLRLEHHYATFVWASALAVLPDDSFLVLGRLPETPYSQYSTPVVGKFLADGALDTRFADQGLLFLSHNAFRLKVQSDGRFLVAGDTAQGSDATQIILRRFLADGAPDTTFATNGELVTQFESELYGISDLALQADGKIVLTATSGFGIYSDDEYAVLRLNADGSLDSTFDADGKVLLDFNGSADYAYALAIQPDGKIISLGSAGNAEDAGDKVVLVRLNADGSLDSSFDGDGQWIPDFGDRTTNFYNLLLQPDGMLVSAGQIGHRFNVVRYTANAAFDRAFATDGEQEISTSDSWIKGLALQADGKIVVGGYVSTDDYDGNSDWTLLRYLPDGSLDPNFGTAGKVVTHFYAAESDNRVQALLLQPDGKIVAAGRAFLEGGFWGLPGLGLARYLPDGSPDPTFEEDGKLDLRIDLTIEDETCALVLQADGKIVVGGSLYGDPYDHFAVVRVNADGSVDSAFGEAGTAIADFGSASAVRGLALQADGKIIAVGTVYDAENYTLAFAVARFLSDGALDPSFGNGGKVITSFNQSEGAYAVQVQPDGNLLVGGDADSPTSSGHFNFTLVRYAADGTLDSSFGTAGIASTSLAEYHGHSLRALRLQADHKILAAGAVSDSYNRDFALLRYNVDGTPDLDFGQNGAVTTDFGSINDTAYALALQADGKLIAAGSSDRTFALARYTTEGKVYRVFLPSLRSTAGGAVTLK